MISKHYNTFTQDLHPLPNRQKQQPATLGAGKPFRFFFGGPDRPPRLLRDLLEERIHAVPSGGEIFWITYYFRDEGLADALVKAQRRGVRVRVAMEGNPRTGAVNSRVRKRLEGTDALEKNLRVLTHRLIDNRFMRTGRLHEKLYYFSHPVASALAGTFNPSGNTLEEPAIIRKIGDQDRGHNALVEIFDPVLVQGLHAHAQHIFTAAHGPWERFLPVNNRTITAAKTSILFFPRWRFEEFDRLFRGLGSGASVRLAVSHLNDRRICKRLFGLSRQGVRIEILAHDTQRRVPSWVEKNMLRNGIVFNRYVHPEGLPMHNKFMLIEASGRQVVTFGSMNLSVRSLHANHELLLISENPAFYQAFRRRWDEIFADQAMHMQTFDGPGDLSTGLAW